MSLLTVAAAPALILMSDSDDDDELDGEAAEAIKAIDDEPSAPDGAVYDIPAGSGATTLGTFEPGIDRVAIHAPSLETEFTVEEGEGSARLSYDEGGSAASVTFSSLDAVPTADIDIVYPASEGGGDVTVSFDAVLEEAEDEAMVQDVLGLLSDTQDQSGDEDGAWLAPLAPIGDSPDTGLVGEVPDESPLSPVDDGPDTGASENLDVEPLAPTKELEFGSEADVDPSDQQTDGGNSSDFELDRSRQGGSEHANAFSNDFVRVIEGFVPGETILELSVDGDPYAPPPVIDVETTDNGLDAVITIDGAIAAILPGGAGATLNDIRLDLSQEAVA
ncbi:MAG: hypothetical protein AAFR35_09065 [Pseudomonadota bacterium]